MFLDEEPRANAETETDVFVYDVHGGLCPSTSAQIPMYQPEGDVDQPQPCPQLQDHVAQPQACPQPQLDPVTGHFASTPRQMFTFTAESLLIPPRPQAESAPVERRETGYNDISFLPAIHTDGLKAPKQGIMLQIKSIEAKPDEDIHVEVSDSFYYTEATLHNRYRMHIG